MLFIMNSGTRGMNVSAMKQAAARAAIEQVPAGAVLGVGTGSTVDFFIDELPRLKGRFEAAVSSSKASTQRMRARGIPVIELNNVDELSIYVDGADEVTPRLQMLKGGGGALTGEKIVAAVARRFVCIADQGKLKEVLGAFGLPVEVIPLAWRYVERELTRLGGRPRLREGFVTDYGNLILDVHGLEIADPVALESAINQIAGVVTNGLFARRPADLLLLGTEAGVRSIGA